MATHEFDVHSHFDRQGVPFFEVYGDDEDGSNFVIRCRTSNASIFAVGFARTGKQYVFLDRQHINYLLLVGRMLDFEGPVQDEIFDTLPADRVIRELALIRLAERALNVRSGDLSLSIGILSRRTVLFPRIFCQFHKLMATGRDLAAEMKAGYATIMRQFVVWHEFAHLEIQVGVAHSDAKAIEIVRAVSATYRTCQQAAKTARLSGKRSYATDISDYMTSMMASPALMEEVTADLSAFRDDWLSIKESVTDIADTMLAVLTNSILKSIAAASILGIYDNVLGADNRERLTEQVTRYRNMSFVRFEFLAGFAKILAFKDFENQPVADELYEGITSIADDLRARFFPMLDEEMTFILSGAVDEIRSGGETFRDEEALDNDGLLVACGAYLGWINLGDAQRQSPDDSDQNSGQ